MSTFRQLSRNFLLPYGNLTFFRLYLFLWSEVSLKRSPFYVAFLATFQFISLYLGGLYLVQYLLTVPPFVHLLLYNASYFFLQSKSLNLIFGFAILGVTFNLGLLYRNTDHWLNSFLASLIFEKRSKPFFHWQTYQGQPIPKYLANYLLKMTHSFTLYICCGYAFGFSIFLFMLDRLRLYGTFWFTSPTGLTLLFFHCLNLIISTLFFIGFAHFLFLIFFLFFFISRIFTIKFTQFSRLLRAPFQLSHQHVCTVQRNLVQILTFLEKANGTIGRIFTISLFISLPMSVQSVTWIISGQLTIPQMIIVSFPGLIQLVGLFEVHYVLATFSKRIHCSSKTLYHHLVAKSKWKLLLHLKTRLRLVDCITVLHTNRPYGFTYWIFGQITLISFSKFILLYGKFILKTINLNRI